MSALAIYGVPLPVAVGSLKQRLDPVGLAPTRNANGYLVTDRRAVRRTISGACVVRSLEEAALYAELIQARGDYWSMYADAYSAKGLAVTGTGAWNGGRAWALAAGQTMVVPCPLQTQDAVLGNYAAGVVGSRLAGRDGGTLIGWRAGGTSRVFAWGWRETDIVPAHRRERLFSGGTFGAPQAYSGDETLAWSYSAQTLTVTAGAGSSFYGLLWIPRRFEFSYGGSTALDTLLAGMSALWTERLGHPYLPAPPRVLAQMDVLPASAVAAGDVPRNLVVLGQVHALDVVPAWIGGLYERTAMTVGFSLTEV